MRKARTPILCSCLMGLFCRFAVAQDAMDLELVKIGHLKTKNGHTTGYRIYKAPDGTEGQVHYTKFDWLERAEMQIEEWTKTARTITSREHNQSKDGQPISDRILAVADLPKSDKKEFMIIRLDELRRYVIESLSLQVALKVESLIEHQ